MIFEQIKIGDMENFSYIIGDSGEAAVVDIGFEHEKLIEISKKQGLKIRKILLTHGHFDHAQEVKKLIRETNAEVYVHELEGLKGKGFHFIKDGDVIKIRKIKIKVIHTPGHTSGGICYLVDEKKLLTGDTLFVNGIGRVDLPESNLEDMKTSLMKLSELDDNIEVWPGHDYGDKESSTIGEEKESNPYMN